MFDPCQTTRTCDVRGVIDLLSCRTHTHDEVYINSSFFLVSGWLDTPAWGDMQEPSIGALDPHRNY